MSETAKNDAVEPVFVRDDKGRFLKGFPTVPGGARPGAGRPSSTRRELVEMRMSGANWDKIIAMAIQKAEDGDIRFIEWLSDQRYGKQPVVSNVELTGGLAVAPVARLSDVELEARIADLSQPALDTGDLHEYDADLDCPDA